MAVLLDQNEVPPGVAFEASDAGGSKVQCRECGLDWEEAWSAGGAGAYVWTYEADASGIAIWVRATCVRCGRVEIFSTSGGNSGGGSRRNFNDLDRKHGEAHDFWEKRQ